MLQIKEELKGQVIVKTINGRSVRFDSNKVHTQSELKKYQKLGFDIFTEDEEKPKKTSKKYENVDQEKDTPICGECEEDPCVCNTKEEE